MHEGAAAKDGYRHALEVARQQCGKFWELRAALDRARIWRYQGKRTEARDLLAPIYGWFTEGFDTPILKDAKALLDELRWPSTTRCLVARALTHLLRYFWSWVVAQIWLSIGW
jgi:predicted ATPase